MIKILLAEDDEIMRVSVSDKLKKFGWQVDEASDGLGARELCDKQQYDVVISDIRMPGMDGIGLLQHVLKQSPTSDVIIMTAYGSVDDATRCLREGASEYILKPFDMDDLIIRVKRLIDIQRVRQRCIFLEENCRQEQEKELIGSSAAMQKVYSIIEQAAPTNATILITGESGTGKELAARAVHRRSNRKDKPFISINCAAIPEGLIESEIFGHEKGAFTGADRLHRGKFELANGGTLLLDELADLAGPMQAKLLRVLQESCFERVGGSKTVNVDVRVLGCTSKDLQKEVEEGRFRSDLLYRLQVIPIEMPALREHPEDIDELCRHFLAEFNHAHGRSVSISAKAIACLKQYDFPGNIRELRNIIERALVLCRDSEVGPEDLPSELNSFEQQDDELNLAQALAKTEYRCLLNALSASQGNRTRAAALLGISRKNLWEKLKAHNIA